MISLIVATLGERKEEFCRLLDSLNAQNCKNFEIIIVSQANHEVVEKLIRQYEFNYKHIKIGQRGLSLARNEGLKYIQGNIVTFSDDDCWYPFYAFEYIVSYFNFNNNPVTCFQIYDPLKKKYYKKYHNYEMSSMSRYKIINSSSIEIFINLNKVHKKYLSFDTRFGLGAKIPGGEEIILLKYLLDQNFKISYYPKIIVYHKAREKASKITRQMSFNKGALIKRLYHGIEGFMIINVSMLKKIKRLENFVGCLVNANKGFFYNNHR